MVRNTTAYPSTIHLNSLWFLKATVRPNDIPYPCCCFPRAQPRIAVCSRGYDSGRFHSFGWLIECYQFILVSWVSHHSGVRKWEPIQVAMFNLWPINNWIAGVDLLSTLKSLQSWQSRFWRASLEISSPDDYWAIQMDLNFTLLLSLITILLFAAQNFIWLVGPMHCWRDLQAIRRWLYFVKG